MPIAKWKQDAKILDLIDRSQWLTKDKEWKAERKAKWADLASLFQGFDYMGIYFEGDGKARIQQAKHYFLTGEVYVSDSLNHPELSMFELLYLHPSEDKALLASLRDTIYQRFGDTIDHGVRLYFDACLHMEKNNPKLFLFYGSEFLREPGLGGNEELYMELLLPDHQSYKTFYPKSVEFTAKQIEEKWRYYSHRYTRDFFEYLYVYHQTEEEFDPSRKTPFVNPIVKNVFVTLFDQPDLEIDEHFEQFIALVISELPYFDFEKNQDNWRADYVQELLKFFQTNKLPKEFERIWSECRQLPRISKWSLDARILKLPDDLKYEVI